MVWIFGTGRSGSTWLASMLGEPSGVIGKPAPRTQDRLGHKFWNEPLVGQLLGHFYTEVPSRQLQRENFIFSHSKRDVWLEGIRRLVMDGARTRFPEVSETGYLVIKEPNGSVGAPLLMEALPESRMVLLIRDPRDVVASALDRHRAGGIAHEKRGKDPRRRAGADRSSRADSQPNAFVKGQAIRYVKNVTLARRAFDAHRGYKSLVRYEDLRAGPRDTMQRIHSDLNLPVMTEVISQAVATHTWENVPEEVKGQGKDRRKAKPGGWKEDLTPRQAEIVEDVTAPLLKELYPG